MNQSNATANQNNRNERGAALVVSLLVATVLLVAGGALIQVTSMSARNAIDSTFETQAYYGAEAGLQAALNVLRANTPPSATPMPTGMTRISFRNAVILGRSNDCPNGSAGDPSGVARLSRYLPYSDRRTANTRVTVSTSPTIQYEVQVSLPPGDNCAPAEPVCLPGGTIEPKRLLVQATGYGPNGARKQMSMIVSRNAFDTTIPAMMTLVGTPAGVPAMSFQSGNSNNHIYSGVDNATGLASGLPAFGTTNAADNAIAASNAASNTTSSPATAVVSTLPSYLQSPAAARAFLDQMQAAAILGAAQSPATATYLPTGGSGNPTGFTFVKGDYTMGSGSGSGLLIVTGELTTNGGTNFNGVLIVLGSGYVNRSGGGGGAFYGANFIARVDWPADTPAKTMFGAPFFNFSGSGTATMQYDSNAAANAFQLLPAPVLGVSEQ
ncbi:MAG: pilus assembly PilX N-terminal domain-containing protein [bacterium]